MAINPMDYHANDMTEIGSHHQGTFWIVNLDGPTLASVAPRLAATFQRVGSETAPLLAQAMGLDDPALVLQRFATGRRCYAGRVEDKLTIYGWVTFDEEEIGELGLSFRLQAGEAYIWDCATLPAYRGQRLYPALLTYMLSDLYREGLHRVWIGTDTDNLASQSGLALAGFHPAVDIMLTPALPMRRPWTRGRPGVLEQTVTDVRRALFANREQAG